MAAFDSFSVSEKRKKKLLCYVLAKAHNNQNERKYYRMWSKCTERNAMCYISLSNWLTNFHVDCSTTST